ncbi:MAG: hypothetical protein WD052_02575 [Bacteroidales bacterium]
MKSLIPWILCLPVLSLFGQKDVTAEQFLDNVSKELNPEHALNIEFDYIRDDLKSESTLQGEGSLILMGEKYKIDLGDAVIYFDGTKQYSLQTEIEEVYISVPDPDNTEFLFSDPIRLLRNYKEDFKYRNMGHGHFQGIPATEIQLYPEELGGPYALVKLFFSIEKQDLLSIVIRHKDGILYTMIVTKMKRKEDPGIEFFRFNQQEYPNVDVIELI